MATLSNSVSYEEKNYIIVNYYSNYATTAFAGALNTVGENKNVLVYTEKYYYDDDVRLPSYSSPNSPLYMTKQHYHSNDDWGTSPSGGTLVSWWDDFETAQAFAQALGKDISNGNASVDLYAQWEMDNYCITYDANGGSGAPTAQTKTHGVALILSSEQPTRDGYLFQGWATSPNGMVLYQPGASYATDESATLYAIWRGANLVSKNCRACIKFDGSVKMCRILVRHGGSDTKCKPIINHNDVK